MSIPAGSPAKSETAFLQLATMLHATPQCIITASMLPVVLCAHPEVMKSLLLLQVFRTNSSYGRYV